MKRNYGTDHCALCDEHLDAAERERNVALGRDEHDNFFCVNCENIRNSEVEA